MTDPNEIEKDANCPRSVTFYGYVRGTHLKPLMKVHLIGVGDFDMQDVSVLPDPCPIPDEKKGEQRKTLSSRKDTLIFAPLSNVGVVTFDKDAVYIDIGRVNYTKKENLALTARRNQQGDEVVDEDDEDDNDGSDKDDDEPQYDADTPAGLLKSLQDVEHGVDEKMDKSKLRIFKGSKAVHGNLAENSGDDEDDFVDDNDDDDDDDKSESDSDSSNDDNKNATQAADHAGPSRRRRAVDAMNEDDDESSDSDSEQEEDGKKAATSATATASSWKTGIAERAKQSFLDRQSSAINLQELVYGAAADQAVVSHDESAASKSTRRNKGGDDSSDDEDDEEFFKRLGLLRILLFPWDRRRKKTSSRWPCWPWVRMTRRGCY
jgi:ribosome biogenesis protein BMS1